MMLGSFLTLMVQQNTLDGAAKQHGRGTTTTPLLGGAAPLFGGAAPLGPAMLHCSLRISVLYQNGPPPGCTIVPPPPGALLWGVGVGGGGGGGVYRFQKHFRNTTKNTHTHPPTYSQNIPNASPKHIQNIPNASTKVAKQT